MNAVLPSQDSMTVHNNRPDRFHSLYRDQFDVIVVGAGTGGLTTGALLAKGGKSVLVLDRHDVAGGSATVFQRGNYEFDVGIHYIGDSGPTGQFRVSSARPGVDDVSFRELDPDGFDTLIFPDFTFRVPRGIRCLSRTSDQSVPLRGAGD